MSARYWLTLHNHKGEEIVRIDAFESLNYSLKENEIGGLSLGLADTFYPATLFQRDYTLRIYRQLPQSQTGSLEGQTAFFIRKIRNGKLGRVELEAFSAMHLLSRRIVAYAAGSAFASKDGPADDVIKDIVRENLGSEATDPLRRLTNYLTIQEDSSRGEDIEKAFSRRNVLEVVQELALASTEAGTWIGFDITLNVGTGLYFFQTYAGQRGVDRRYSSSNPTPFPMSSLTDGSYQEDDYTEEATYIYALGRGEEAERAVEVAFDLERIAASPFNRIEVGHQATQAETTPALLDEAATRLQEGRPAFRFSGNLQNVVGSEYGIDYAMGDLITFDYKGRQYDSRVTGIGVQATVNSETITTTLGNV